MEGLKAHNLRKVGTMGAKTVVFSCPTCRQTWRDHYETDLALYHTTQLIEKLVIEGALALKPVNATVTYHDPCDLGRAGGVFDAPRNILRSIPGLRLVEMESHGARSTCCGGGGNLEMADAELSGAVAGRKIEEILRTGADTVVTACQQCVRTIQSQARRRKVPLEVLDITDMVARAL
jgi:heterodisulfide reductase subunit D